VTDDGGDPPSYAIIGAAMEAYRVLGTGFLESIYHQALTIAVGLRGNPFKREVPLSVYYKAQMLASAFRADFLCFDAIIVELKASRQPGLADEAQNTALRQSSPKGTWIASEFWRGAPGNAAFHRRTEHARSVRRTGTIMRSMTPGRWSFDLVCLDQKKEK
jgi:GxxExxY protein